MKHYLFTTQSCPRCPAFKKQALEIYPETIVLNETDEQFSELINKFGISMAPTLVAYDESNDSFETITELYN